MSFDYKQQVHIDESQLDKEWLAHSEYYMEVGEMLADAKFNLGNLVIRLDKLKGQKALDIRTNPKDYKIKIKITNDVIESKINSLPDVVKLSKRINQARREVNNLSSAEVAYQHRKSALTKLTELYLSGYYSELRSQMPKVHTDVIRKSRSDKKTASKLKKRRK